MFSLDEVVPWGRSFDEYRRMFDLADDDLRVRIVGCGDGPASFNAEATRRGSTVVSCDPLYRYDVDELRARIASTHEVILEQTRRNAHEFVWTSIHTIEELGRLRMAAMNAFLDDYPQGRSEGRYVDAELPNLPFDDRSFDLALSSHFLFLYTTQLGEAFHRSAIREMCRVASEVRIFPLLALGGVTSPLVEPIANELRRDGFRVSLDDVPYEFQRGGNRMMRIRCMVGG
jgi:SAM-dependent methyltransferase